MSTGLNRVAAELREVSTESLQEKLRESKEELFNLRFQSVTGQLSTNQRLGQVRREIARIYTIIRERELGIAPAVVETAEPTKTAAAEKSTAKDESKGEETMDKSSARQKDEVAA